MEDITSDGEFLPVADDRELQQIKNKDRKRTREEEEHAKELAKIVAPCNWNVDRIYKEKKGQNVRQDVTAAVLEVIAAHGIRRLVSLRRYKAALAHCISAVPTRKSESRMRAYQAKPDKRTLACISLLPTTEYDYKILRASRFFRVRVTTLNTMLLEIEQILNNTPAVLVPIPASEGGDETDGESSKENRARKGSSNDLDELGEEGDEESAETTEAAADEREPLEANWPIPFDEPMPFTGDMMDETKSRYERFRSFVDQCFYHITCPVEREALDWMVKCMVDPKAYGEAPNIIVRAKILEYFKVLLPSIHTSDFWPEAVRMSDFVNNRVIKIKRTKSIVEPTYTGEENEPEHELEKVWKRMQAEKEAKAKEEKERRERKKKEEMERAEREHKEKKEKKKAKRQAKAASRAAKAKAKRQKEKERSKSTVPVDDTMDPEERQEQGAAEAIDFEDVKMEWNDEDLDHEEILGMEEETESDESESSEDDDTEQDDNFSDLTSSDASFFSVQQGREASDISAILMTDSERESSEASRGMVLKPVKLEVKQEPFDEWEEEEQENMDTTLVGPPPEGFLDGPTSPDPNPQELVFVSPDNMQMDEYVDAPLAEDEEEDEGAAPPMMNPRGLPQEEDLSMYTPEERGVSKEREEEEEAVVDDRAAASDDGAMPPSKRGRSRGRSVLATPTASKKKMSVALADDDEDNEDEEEPMRVLRKSPRGHSQSSTPIMLKNKKKKNTEKEAELAEEEPEELVEMMITPQSIRGRRTSLGTPTASKNQKKKTVADEDDDEEMVSMRQLRKSPRGHLTPIASKKGRKKEKTAAAAADDDDDEEWEKETPQSARRTSRRLSQSITPSVQKTKKKRDDEEEEEPMLHSGRGSMVGRAPISNPSKTKKKADSDEGSDYEKENGISTQRRRSTRRLSQNTPLIASKKRGKKGKEYEEDEDSEEEEEEVTVPRMTRGVTKKMLAEVKQEVEEEEQPVPLFTNERFVEVKEEMVEDEEEEEQPIQATTGRRSLNTPKPSAKKSHRKRVVMDDDEEEEEATTSQPRKSARTATLTSTPNEPKKKQKQEETKKRTSIDSQAMAKFDFNTKKTPAKTPSKRGRK